MEEEKVWQLPPAVMCSWGGKGTSRLSEQGLASGAGIPPCSLGANVRTHHHPPQPPNPSESNNKPGGPGKTEL